MIGNMAGRAQSTLVLQEAVLTDYRANILRQTYRNPFSGGRKALWISCALALQANRLAAMMLGPNCFVLGLQGGNVVWRARADAYQAEGQTALGSTAAVS